MLRYLTRYTAWWKAKCGGEVDTVLNYGLLFICGFRIRNFLNLHMFGHFLYFIVHDVRDWRLQHGMPYLCQLLSAICKSFSFSQRLFAFVLRHRCTTAVFIRFTTWCRVSVLLTIKANHFCLQIVRR